MTKLQNDLIRRMMTGNYYMMPKVTHRGRTGCMLYKGHQDPVKWYSDKTARIIRQLLKRDKRGRLTVNLSLVRRQHGKSLIKQLYNQTVKQSNV